VTNKQQTKSFAPKSARLRTTILSEREKNTVFVNTALSRWFVINTSTARCLVLGNTKPLKICVFGSQPEKEIRPDGTALSDSLYTKSKTLSATCAPRPWSGMVQSFDLFLTM
jgi:hypothetical protein